MKNKIIFGYLFFFFLFFSFAPIALAVAFPGYQPLTSIPGISSDTSIDVQTGGGLANYLNSLYKMGVAAAAGLAVIMVIWGGVEYITAVAGEGKSGGKERITSAILGLLLALGSYIILNTINPDLLKLSFVLPKADIKIDNGIDVSYDAAGGDFGVEVTVGDNGVVYYNGEPTEYTVDQNGYVLDGNNQPASDAGPFTPSGNVGAANQAILAKIASGYSCSTTNCYVSAKELYRQVGYEPQRVYESSNYAPFGYPLNNPTGTARMPVPGEMVDYKFNNTLFHSVIINSQVGPGKYSVWEWKKSTNSPGGLRVVTLNSDPNTIGGVGRIYVPIPK